MIDFKRLNNEKEESYLWRLCTAKINGEIDANWDDIADIMNTTFRIGKDEHMTSSAYRKRYQGAKWFYDAGVFDNSSPNDASSFLSAKNALAIERQKIADERSSLNKRLRELGRTSSVFDATKRAIDNFVSPKFDYSPVSVSDGGNDLIIHLTDLHCGVDIKSPFNTFNSDVLEARLKKYLDEIHEIRDLHKSQGAYLILGGDMIHGLIHVNARIEAKENVIDQVIVVSDLIGKFINELSKWFEFVEVHTTAGNHSRTTPSKEDAVRNENFDLLIPYICKKELQNVKSVRFVDNYLGCDIAVFGVRGHTVYATHGDKDSADNVVVHMTNFARKTNLPLPDICYLGHRHENGLKTVGTVKVIESGCVDGMDNYAIDKRLTGFAEQTVTVVTAKNCVKALYDIRLD